MAMGEKWLYNTALYLLQTSKSQVVLHKKSKKNLEYDLNVVMLNISSIHTSGLIVIVFVSSAVDRGFESRAYQTKNYKICIC